MLSENAKTTTFSQCRLLLDSLTTNRSSLVLSIYINARINRDNDRWLTHDTKEAPNKFQSNLPANVHA